MSDLLLRDFSPRPKLVTPVTIVEAPRFPLFDAHNHLGPEFGGDWISKPIAQLIEAMDRVRMTRLVRHPEYKYARELYGLTGCVCGWPDESLAGWPASAESSGPGVEQPPRPRGRRAPRTVRREGA